MELYDVKFLFNNDLPAGLENLIKEAKKELTLISPYINLDERIKVALKSKMENPNFELTILFGKAEKNYYDSLKKESADFFMQFPNVVIKYEKRLHAKFYKNDFQYLITSMNLYNYSIANNIEVGMLCTHSSKGFIGKAFDAAGEKITEGTEKLKSNLFGANSNDVDPIEEFNDVVKNAITIFKKEPQFENAKGLKGVVGRTVYTESKIIENKFKDTKEFSKPKPQSTSTIKKLSLTQLSKKMGLDKKVLSEMFEKDGLIINSEITDKGKSLGLELRQYMGNEYIAFPESLLQGKK